MSALPPLPRGGYLPEAALVAGLLVLAALVASTCGGCGPSALRGHATAATIAMATVATAGDAIEVATAGALAACPAAPGSEVRGACLDRVEQASVAAATVRDGLIPLVHGYRDAVLLGQDAEQSPALLEALVAFGLRVARELDAMRGAIAVLEALGRHHEP